MTDFNEKQLEELLTEHLSETSLVNDLNRINPFNSAITKIITGMVLITITLQFLYLNYILPVIGIMLIYLGMRTLRHGNRWFTAGWLAALASLIMMTMNLVLAVTPYNSVIESWSGWAAHGVRVFFLFCLGMGMWQAGLDAGLKHPKMPTWPVILWQLVLIILAAIQVNGWTVLLFMLYAWIRMVKHIVHCADDLEKAGYVVPVSPVWFSAKPLMAAYLTVLLAVMFGTSILVNYTPVDGKTADLVAEVNAAETVEIRETLLAVGFPETVLADIQNEHLLDLGSAENIRAVDTGSDMNHTDRMEGRSVSVKLADGRMKTFVWFEYAEGTHAGLVDSVKMQYDENQINYGAEMRLLWENGGTTWLAEPHLTEYTSQYLWFGDISTNAYYTTKYSFPFRADHPRGYITWWTEEEDGRPVTWSMNSTTFHCLRTPMVLPYVELPQNMDGVVLFGGFGDGWGQEKFQIYATPRFGEA